MAEAEESPLVKALPPETDYLTYLTIVEYNLNKEQLPVLHTLLQDETLTTNIGWDLVGLLLPLLPESEQCLQDVAFLGNPRETVLKVAELLYEIGRRHVADDDDEEGGEGKGIDSEQGALEQEAKPRSALLALQFQSLLHMLCILHPRIKTQYPSRFLMTSVQAVVPAYKAVAHTAESIGAVLMLLKSLSGSSRPHLPPRKSQQAIPRVSDRISAPDPEAQTAAPGKEEEGLQKRILRSFVTHVAEIYIHSLNPAGETSQFAWSDRFFEKRYPERILPRQETYRSRFQKEADLERRDASISQILSTADSDLTMPWQDLLECITEPDDELGANGSVVSLEELPLSRIGALYCVAARVATALLNDRPASINLSLFPQHEELASRFLDIEEGVASMVQTVDATLILGWAALEATDGVAEAETRAEFSSYLQRISFTSANMPLPSMRFQAHAFASAVLRGNPSSEARLDFIQDTLEHCPYANLKVTAVGWLKDEILMAFDVPLNNSSFQGTEGLRITNSTGDSSNAFAQPSALRACAPWLFATPDTSSMQDMATNFPFWLAALNLYYLLCSSPLLYKRLEVHRLAVEFNVDKDFVAVLAALVEKSIGTGPSQSSDIEKDFGAELHALDDVLARLRSLDVANAGPSD